MNTKTQKAERVGGTKGFNMETYLKDREEHPGVYYLADLAASLGWAQWFLDTAEGITFSKKSSPLLTCLNGILSDMFSPEARQKASSPYPLVFDYTIPDEVIKDLRQCLPGTSPDDIYALQKKVADLQYRQEGIYATRFLLLDPGFQGPARDHAMLRLNHMWSGFRKSLKEITESDATTNLLLAIHETRHMSSLETITLADLPKRLYRRTKDYKNGRSDPETKQTKHISLEEMIEEPANEELLIDPSFSPEDAYERMDHDLQKEKLLSAMTILTPTLRAALVKHFRQEKLTPAEHRAAYRAINQLKAHFALKKAAIEANVTK